MQSGRVGRDRAIAESSCLDELSGALRRKALQMKLTMKGDYGLRAMLDLAMHYGQGPIESADIAQRQGVPEPDLNQILMTLRKEGLIESMRGPGGGQMLASQRAQIPKLHVLK